MRAVVLSIAAGCGGTPSIHTTLDNLCDQIAAVACYDIYQCCTPDAIETVLGTTIKPSEAECRDRMKQRCITGTAPQQLSVARGRTTFDGPTMDRCLEALVVGDSCITTGDAPPWVEPCRLSPWVGTGATDDPCTATRECVRDDFCQNRVCTSRGLSGSPCAASEACMPDLSCDATFGTCTSRASVGERCAGDDTCTSGTCALGVCAVAGFACSRECSFCMISKVDCRTMACPTNDSCVNSTCDGDHCVANVSDYCNGPLAALPLPP